MKKIGIFCGYYLPHLGGVERYVDKLSQNLIELGYEVVIVTSKHEQSLKSYEKKSGLKVYRLPIRKMFKERYPVPLRNNRFNDLIQRIDAEKFDYYIVNTRFHLTSLIGAKMGRRNQRPVLLIEHGTGHFTIGNKLLDYFGKVYEHVLSRILKSYVDAYYGVSKKCNEWLKHFSIEARGVFYNAVSKSSQTNVKDYYVKKYPKDKLVITYAGRLIKEKGILNLIEVYEHLKKDFNSLDLRLVIAGDGDLYESLKKNLDDSTIDMLGKLDFEHVMSLYKRTDIFVYPSLYPEGLPTSILEAGLMNCAVVATPKGGTAEVITDGQHGIIIDGSIKSLRVAITLLLKHAALRKRYAKNLQSRVETTFEWQVVANTVDKEIKVLEAELG